MTTYELRCWPAYFEQIVDGSKTFEVRLGNFPAVLGDILVLKEYDPHSSEYSGYSGRELTVRVTYRLHIPSVSGLAFWPEEEQIKHGVVILSFKVLSYKPRS